MSLFSFNYLINFNKVILFLFSFAITSILLSFIYLPLFVSVLIYIILFFLKEKTLILLSINFSLLSILLTSFYFSDLIIKKNFVTPHQKLISEKEFNYINYPKNRVLKDQFFLNGDLFTLENLSKEYSTPRRVDFITDNLGFRNSQNFIKGSLIVLGDSYVVGNGGVDQNDTISSKLSKYSGKKFYNMGFPGDPFNYYHRLIKHENLIYDSSGIIFFLFEGNDLNCANSSSKPRVKKNQFIKTISKISNYRITFFENTFMYKLGILFYHRVTEKIFNKKTNIYHSVVNGKKVAFLKNYVDYVYNNEICPKRIQEISAIFDKYSHFIKLLVYVPTKGHVYYKSLNNPKPLPIKAEKIKSLSSKYNIEFLNLSNFFIKENKNHLLYFSDDSHWNSNGIDLAAKVIVKHFKLK